MKQHTTSANHHAIHQDATRDELHAALFERSMLFRSAMQRWHTALSRTLGGSSTDIFRGQGRALALLAKHGEMAQRDMCAALSIRPQSLGETLAKLERAGYIERRPSTTDHRALMVRITESGREFIAHAEQPLPSLSFTEDELKQFIAFMDRALHDIETQAGRIEQELEHEVHEAKAELEAAAGAESLEEA